MIKLILFLFLVFPFSVFAYSGPLTPEYFTFTSNNVDAPYHFTINSNSSTNVEFHMFVSQSYDRYDPPSPYLMVTLVSSKKLDIVRANSFGSVCNQSCFSNERYLLLTDDNNGYSYSFYINIYKQYVVLGSQIASFQVDDTIKFTNKESGTADVYIYAVYANPTNEVPNFISNQNVINAFDDGTTTITNNDNQNTQDIIDNQNANTNSTNSAINSSSNYIVDNANQNKQEIIESTMICRDIDVKDIKQQDKMLYNNGEIGTNGFYSITDYFAIFPTSKLRMTTTFNYQSNTELCFYDKNKTVISCLLNTSLVQNQYITIPNNTSYVRFSIRDTNNEPQFKLCNNGNQENNQAINDINSSINNSGIDNPNSDFSDMEDMIAHNGVITNLIALPITLYSSILNNVNASCSSFSLGRLYGTNLTFNCINLGSLFGSTIWGVIDVLFSGFAIYAISKKMIKVFNNFSGLQEGDVIDD